MDDKAWKPARDDGLPSLSTIHALGKNHRDRRPRPLSRLQIQIHRIGAAEYAGVSPEQYPKGVVLVDEDGVIVRARPGARLWLAAPESGPRKAKDCVMNTSALAPVAGSTVAPGRSTSGEGGRSPLRLG